ncbi:glycosyltransferase family 4 protein [uncultured Tateyamaria sp.]|uniref:glycosyltransferase family 4 protein n=1 Tax=uncultured Tateyamaria sp. TaxID=455651 RepID=UPI002619538C|nr:glycosyltransferase family 4 protein [uncultured Tateyamaria sp.]
MHIAYVCTDPGIPVWGAKGASIHVQEMLRAFLKRDAKVTLLTPRTEGAPPSDLAGVELHPLPPAPKGDAESRARALLATNDTLANALDMLQPDLVYERHALMSCAAMEWSARNDRPGVLEVNAPLIAEQAAHRQLALPEQAETAAQRSTQAARLSCAVTEPVAQYVRDMGGTDVIVVPNAVNPARFPAPRPRPERPFTVGFLGSMKPWHGLNTLVQAFAQLRHVVPDARLLIVGDGPERAQIEVQVREYGLSGATEITGLLPAADVPSALARMDVGTAPYHAMEDFYFSPLKIYEYMAAALPVVTTHTGDLALLVTDTETGLITPPGDAYGLTQALAQLAADLPWAQAMGKAARAHVLAHHTWDATADHILTRALDGKARAA